MFLLHNRKGIQGFDFLICMTKAEECIMDAIIVVSEDQSGSSDCNVLFGTSKAAKWFQGLTKMRNDQLPFQAKVLPQNWDTRLKAKTWQSRRYFFSDVQGDVLSGTSSNGMHHAGILEEWFGFHWWNGRVPILVLTIVLILAPLVSFKRVDSLKFTSSLSVALAVVFVVIIAGIVIVKLFSGTVKAPRLLPDIVDFTSFLKLFTVVPVIVTAYICHYNVHSIYNELEDPSEMQPIVRTTLASCSIVYISTSFFGFLLFGDQTMDDVLANFDTNLGVPYSVVLNDIVHVTYVVHLMLVFPLIFFSLGLNLDGLVFPAKKHLVLDNKRFILITAGLIGIIFLGASFIPSIWDAFQFTGATTAVCIGFIFPAPVALRDTHGISTRKDIFIALFMIFLEVVSSSIAIVSDINSLFNKEEEGPPRS